MRRFEFKEGSSKKFWEVTVSGNTLTGRFGRIGTAGQEKSKTFATPVLAQKEQDKLIAGKQGKGYKGSRAAEQCQRRPASLDDQSGPPGVRSTCTLGQIAFREPS